MQEEANTRVLLCVAIFWIKPRFDKPVSSQRMSLVSTNESRFEEWVSFRGTSLVSTNESLFSNKRVLLKIVYRVTHKSWRFKIEWFPRNWVIQIFLGSIVKNINRCYLVAIHTHTYIYIYIYIYRFYSVLLTLLTVQCKARIQPKGPCFI